MKGKRTKPLLFFFLCILLIQANGQNPLLFTENKGQWHHQVLYAADLTGGKLVLERDKFSFLFQQGNHHNHSEANDKHQVNPTGHKHNIVFENSAVQQMKMAKSTAYYRNYFIGSDASKWASNVKLFEEAVYNELYPGIDLLVRGDGTGIEYAFVVKPNADVSRIIQRYEGVDAFAVSKNSIKYKTPLNTFTESKLVAYQIINGSKIPVDCIFKKIDDNKIAYHFPNGYDKSYELIIDPTIIFSTYTGATADNFGYTATYGHDASMYVGGYVNATPPNGNLYPTTPGAFQPVYGGGSGSSTGSGGNLLGFPCDMGITRFNASGTALIFSTFIGGSDNETPHSLVVDDSNNLVIYGVSFSADYPVSPNAFDNSYNGGGDIVVTKISADGTSLIGSTFIGGTGMDGLNFAALPDFYGGLKYNYGDQNRGEVITDDQNNIYVSSCTQSSDFPVSAASFQTPFGGIQDGCVFKLNHDCSQRIWSSYLGGNNHDAAYSLDLGTGNSVYVSGGTMSNNFTTTTGVLNQNYLGGSYDGFITHINANGSSILNSTFVGTNGNDQNYFVKLDSKRNVYVIGQTTGSFPVVNAAYSNPNSGQYILKLNPQLDSIVYSTTFGNGNSRPNISPTAFLVDTCENVYVSGWGDTNGDLGNVAANMSNMPLTNDAFQTTTDGIDFYFFVLGKNASSMLYGSYFGGNGGYEHVDGGTSRFDRRGVIYQAMCAGCGRNSLTPTTPGVWSPTNQSLQNCNLLGLKLDMELGATEVNVNAFPRTTGCVPLRVQFTSQLFNVQSIEWRFGDGTSSTQPNPVHIFTDTGTYRVMLIGYDPNSCNEHDTAYVEVWVRHDSISADFTQLTTINCVTNTVSIAALGTATTKYLWDLGDGTQSTNSSVNHRYIDNGYYTVSLIVSDTARCNLADTFETQLFIPEFVNLDIDADTLEGCIPLTISFQNNTTYQGGDYKWYFGDGDSSDLRNPVHTYQTSGVYTAAVYWSDSTTCNKIDSAFYLIRTIDSFAVADFRVSRRFFECDSAQITVVSDYIGEDAEFWDFGNGITSTDDSVTVMYYAPTFDTIIHIIVDSDKICKPTDTVFIIISLDSLRTDITVSDTFGCLPLTTVLTGVSILPTTNYYWFFGDGDSASGNPVQHTFSAVDTFTVLQVAIDSNACISIDSNYATIIVIDDSVTADFMITILNQCDSNLYIQLTDSSTNAVNYYWTFNDSITSTIQNPDMQYNLPGTYEITLIAEDTSRCHPRDTITKSVTLKPNMEVTFDVYDLCEDDFITIIPYSNLFPQGYSWTFGDGAISFNDTVRYQYNTEGSYTVTLIATDTASCNVTDTISKTITVFPLTDAIFTSERDTYRFETPVIFTNLSTDANSYLWNFGDGDTSAEFSPTHVYDHTFGWHKVCLLAYNDFAPCPDTVCKDIYILFIPLIGVPNAFSPNGDGINDVVYVEGKGMVEFEFRIFNRWGLEVFATENPKQGWDGTYKGVLQEMEVYTYLVKVKFINGVRDLLKGNITLLR